MILPIVVLVAVLRFVDLHQVAHALLSIPLPAVLLVLLLLVADRAAMGLKWRHLVNGTGGHLSVNDAVGIYFQTGFAALLLPTSLGGEALRVGLGRRSGIPGDQLLASMIVEKLVGGVSNALLAAAGLIYLLGSGRSEPTSLMALVAVASGTAALLSFLASQGRLHRWAGRLFGTLAPMKVRNFLNRLSSRLVIYGSQGPLLGVNLVMNVLEHVLQFLAMYTLGRALGVTLGFWPFLAATAVVMLARRTAGFLESFGLGEGGAILLYAAFGVPPAISVSLALALWATSIIAASPGAYLLWRRT
jgi:hypothetical protein